MIGNLFEDTQRRLNGQGIVSRLAYLSRLPSDDYPAAQQWCDAFRGIHGDDNIRILVERGLPFYFRLLQKHSKAAGALVEVLLEISRGNADLNKFCLDKLFSRLSFIAARNRENGNALLKAMLKSEGVDDADPLQFAGITSDGSIVVLSKAEGSVDSFYIAAKRADGSELFVINYFDKAQDELCRAGEPEPYRQDKFRNYTDFVAYTQSAFKEPERLLPVADAFCRQAIVARASRTTLRVVMPLSKKPYPLLI